ncbi:6,7-dimethyl-8-ribityllumazine synthase [Profundibacter sp.]
MTQDKTVTRGDTTETRIAIVVSRFNTEVTSGLLKGALAYLGEQGIAVRPDAIKDAPGAFEIPLIAQTLVRSGRFDGVICLGCVVKGETAHFEYISDAASKGLMNVSLETGVPLTFGILTTYTQDQAIARSLDDAHNKGREAAAACVETITTIRQISTH